MVRRFIIFGFLFFLTASFAAPAFADFAGVPCPANFKYCDAPVGKILSDLLPFVFGLASMLALFFLILGGIRYMTSRGDPKAVDSARSTITGAVTGLLIILFSATIFFIIAAVFKIKIFGSAPFVPSAYAADGVDIGCTLKLGDQCISAAFPNIGTLFTRLIQLALFVAGLVFFAMITWGGFRYLNAGGDPKTAGSARQTLTNAGIGLLIVVVSFVIIEILTRMAGQGGVF